jgi:DNA-binding MarR family transcriptional regulator
VRRGLVRLDADPNDRRVRIARLTHEGRETLARTPGSSELGGAVMVDGLSEGDQLALVRLLKYCADNLLSHMDSGEAAGPGLDKETRT